MAGKLTADEKVAFDRWCRDIGSVKAITKVLLVRRMVELNVLPVWKMPEDTILPAEDLERYYAEARAPALTPEFEAVLRELGARD